MKARKTIVYIPLTDRLRLQYKHFQPKILHQETLHLQNTGVGISLNRALVNMCGDLETSAGLYLVHQLVPSICLWQG